MKNSKADRTDRNRQAIAGLKKHSANIPSMTINGTPYTPAAIETILQDPIDRADATTIAAATFHKAVAAERAAVTAANALYRGMRTLLIHQYKTAPDTLADFGITLAQRQQPSAETVAGAVGKRQATRVVRHTMGTRQKAAIKGTATATAPPVTPSASASPIIPSPAAQAAGSGTSPRVS